MLEALNSGPVPPKPDVDGEKALAAIDWAPVLRDGNHGFDRLVAAMHLKSRQDRERELTRIDEDDRRATQTRRPSRERRAGILLGKPDKTVGKAISKSFTVTIGLASVLVTARCISAHDRDEQVQHNVQVAFALAAYRCDHGDYPTKLEDLAPQYLPTVPDDLFSGKALIYRPSGKGYLFYSVGVNGWDEGGRSADDDPPGDDLRVTMPLPELRPKK